MKVLLFANTDWYLYNFRLPLAKALRDAGHEVVLVSPAGPYGDRLRELGFSWLEAPMHRRSLNPWRELILLAWLRRVIREQRADLVHGFTIKCAVYGSLAARFSHLAGNAPAVVNAVAGMGYVFTSDDLKARILRPFVRLLMRFALDAPNARLILQNPDDVSLFVTAKLVHPARVRMIPGSGVDCSRFRPPTSGDQRAPEDPFRVVLPARVLWDKGVAEFAEAARILKRDGRRIELLLAGTGDPGNPASVPESRVREWVAEGLLTWLGHVEDMPALFRAVDAVALPSYREGLPKGLIEAAACGLPLVTTDVPGCREVVTHEVDGLLVPAKDPSALALAIARLQDEPALRTRLAQASRAKVLTEFDERIVVQRTLGVYSELWKPRSERGANAHLMP